jgi:hypothetical protein
MQDVLGANDWSSLSTSIGKHKKTKYYYKRQRSKTGNPAMTQGSPHTESLSDTIDDKQPMTTWDPEVIQKTGKLQQSSVNQNTTTTSADRRPPTMIRIIERPMPIDKPIAKPRDPLTMDTDLLTPSQPTEEQNSALARPCAIPRRRKHFTNTWHRTGGRTNRHWPEQLKPLIQQIKTALRWKPERPFDVTEFRFEATTNLRVGTDPGQSPSVAKSTQDANHRFHNATGKAG